VPNLSKERREAGLCWRCGADPNKPSHRPLKLDEELQAAICKLIERGNIVATACQANGVSQGKYYEWRQRGARGEEPFATFREQVDRAFAKAETDIVEEIRQAHSEKQRSNKALQFLLERTRRERWGPSISIKVEEAKTTFLDAAHSVLEPEAFESLLQALESHGGELEGHARLPGPEPIH
jgi:hypothetical protein